jgi:hypothetical protein
MGEKKYVCREMEEGVCGNIKIDLREVELDYMD